MKKVKDLQVSRDTSLGELAKQFSESGGFTAKMVGEGAEIWQEIQDDCDLRILATHSCLSAAGTRGIIRDLLRDNKINMWMTSVGSIAHDIIRLHTEYLPGSFEMDDVELHKKGMMRLGNILIPKDVYGPLMEDKVQPMLDKFYKQKKEWNTRELIWAIGEQLSKLKNCEESTLYWAWKNKIPVYTPAPMDGALGNQLWMFWQTHKDFKLNLFEDEQDIFLRMTDAKKVGALVAAGGPSKHHILWWAQFRGGLDYSIYISAHPEWDGTLSGAKTREAISWGKMKEKAKHVTIPADASLVLPLIL